jgi:leader peptidase (prepilin peptidase)/N-methyltransferase
LLTALAFYACARTWSFEPPTFVNSLFLAVVIILIFTDFNLKILPNVLTIPGTVAGILLSPLQNHGFYYDLLSMRLASLLFPSHSQTALPWIGSVIGSIIAGGVLLVVSIAYEMVRKKQGLGMGDVKMMAMVGAFLGWPLAWLTIFAGSLLGSVLGIFGMIFRNMSLQTKLAFGVFLGLGTAFSLFKGPSFLHWYLNFYR